MTPKGTARPLCPSCGRGYVIRRGTQRCFTLPGDPRYERDTATEAPAPQPGRAAVAHLGIACALIGAVTSCTPSSPTADATPAAVSATVLRGWSVGCWGPEAARFAADTLTGQRIALVTDPGQDSHDRYGRTYLH